MLRYNILVNFRRLEMSPRNSYIEILRANRNYNYIQTV